jgi:hypothetical protein
MSGHTTSLRFNKPPTKEEDEMKLTTHQTPDNQWMATDDGYDGSPDSTSIVGHGSTEQEAIADYAFRVSERDFVPESNYCNNPECDSCADEIKAEKREFQAAIVAEA